MQLNCITHKWLEQQQPVEVIMTATKNKQMSQAPERSWGN